MRGCKGLSPGTLPMGLSGGNWGGKSGLEKECSVSIGVGYFTIVGRQELYAPEVTGCQLKEIYTV